MKNLSSINSLLLVLLILPFGINQFYITKTYQSLGINNGFAKISSSITTKDKKLSGEIMDDTVKLVISQGVPEIYGEELGVSFDQVQSAINVMRKYDPTYGKQKITLTGDDLQRYIDVGLKISCEYCCSAVSIVRNDGDAACGCAHSIAMRGLLAYLIQNHGHEYTNDELLRELSLWKGVYFPKQMIKEMAEQLQSGEYTPDIASIVLGLELPSYGDSTKDAPLPSEIENLPGMVGGC